MCGRFNVSSDPLTELFLELVGHPFPGEENFNTAPTEPAWIVRHESRQSEEIIAAEAKWWLTPYWSKTPTPKFATFNAKSETLLQSNAFKEPFRNRRCLVPVSGFYEWLKDGKNRLPYYIDAAGGMVLAGLWDRWRSRDRTEVIESFTIVTTAVNDKLSFIHDRQPVMLSRDDARRWMSRDASIDELQALLGSSIPWDIRVTPVSTYVSNSRNKEPRCIEPIGDTEWIAKDSSDE